jgi:transcriptional regulator with XRE-family HTH domain
MARTPGQRGPIGRWLVEQREQRGWATAEIARTQLERLGGIHLARSVYAEYESGRRVPTEGTLQRLIDFYGTGPGEDVTPGTTLDRIATALEAQVRQTQTLNGLLAALLARDESGVDPAIRTDLLRFAADVVPGLSPTPGLPQPAPGPQTAAPR